MGFTLAQQTDMFLRSCVLGAALGMLYETCRISRIAMKLPAGIVALQDICYFVICAFLSFSLVLNGAAAPLFGILLFGELLGWIVYHYTIGALVIRMADGIIRGVKWLLHLLFLCFIRPLQSLFWRLFMFLIAPIRLFYVFLTKKGINLIFALKQWLQVLYNSRVIHVKKAFRTRANRTRRKHEYQKDQKKQ